MTSPIRVDRDTDERITHAAGLLGVSKKEFVAEAVNAYIGQKMPELGEGLRRVAALLAPSSIVVSPATLGSVVDLVESPPEPTRRLRKLRDA